MALMSDLLSAGAHLQAPMPNDEYDRRIRELVDYLKRLSSTKTLDPAAYDESFLDVRAETACFESRQPREQQANRQSSNSISTRQKTQSHISSSLACRFRARRSEAATPVRLIFAPRGNYGRALPSS